MFVGAYTWPKNPLSEEIPEKERDGGGEAGEGPGGGEETGPTRATTGGLLDHQRQRQVRDQGAQEPPEGKVLPWRCPRMSGACGATTGTEEDRSTDN